ncbi:MAG: hypothetical protein ACREMQ_23650 [Longimicrobiales bacterium]
MTHPKAPKMLAICLMVAGLAAVGAAFGLDLMPFGSPGFGTFQRLLLAAGILALLTWAFATSHGRSFIASRTWRAPFAGPAATPREILLLTLFASVVVGLLDRALAFVQSSLFDNIRLVGPDAVWMAPVSSLVLLCLPAAVLALAAVKSPALVSQRVAAFCVSGFAALCLIEALPGAGRIQFTSRVLLAAGAGAVAARVLSRHDGGRRDLSSSLCALARLSSCWAPRCTPTRSHASVWRSVHYPPRPTAHRT